MPFYIVCQKKKNNPRMDVRICQKKCELKDDCKEYIAFHNIAVQKEDPPISAESQSIQMELAWDKIP